MWVWVVCYVSLGLILAVSMRKVRDIVTPYLNSRPGSSRNFARAAMYELGHFEESEPNNPTWKVALLLLIFAVVWTVVWPVLVPAFIYEHYKEYKELREIPDGLTFSWMGGHGEVVCHDCGGRNEVTSFTHGFGEDSDSTSGFQCQTCFKFTTIDNSDEHNTTYHCDCGGELSREALIRCPDCQSKQVEYELEYIT